MRRFFSYSFSVIIFCTFFSCHTSVAPSPSDFFTDDSFTEPIEHIIQNVPYEKIEILQASQWHTWSRTENALTFSTDENGISFLKHTGSDDYSITFSSRTPVKKGECYQLSANVYLPSGNVTASFVTRKKVTDKSGSSTNETQVINWNESYTKLKLANGYQALYSIITIDGETDFIEPRIIGEGLTEAKIKNVTLEKVSLPVIKDSAVMENQYLSVECKTDCASLTVKDKRNGRTYLQSQKKIPNCILIRAEENKSPESSISLTFLNPVEKILLNFKATLTDEASIEYTINETPQSQASGKAVYMNANLSLPQKNISTDGDYLVLPINEGMCFDWNDSGMPVQDFVTFSGHGLCMPFYGITSSENGSGLITIIKTPDDCAVKLSRDETNCAGTVWYSQKGCFGYERKAVQNFFTDGGHTKIAKIYREYAKQNGTLLTFDEKKTIRGHQAAENINRLSGAANIWCSYYEWNGHTPEKFVQQIIDSGIDRILWSNKQSAEVVKHLNEKGILTGRYDIYQDIMNPANFSLTKYISQDWLPEAYPKDIVIDADGNYLKAWGVESKEGNDFIYCNALCDMTACNYARSKISAELEEIPFGARFLDTTTASSLRECYSSVHPMTRTQSREARYELLKIVSEENGLVCGSETGMDFCVPVCDYFEGMLSLGPYRIEDAGRNVEKIIDSAPSQITEYQLNEKRRLPLWELVYHDCCVAMWYWGDTNNKIDIDSIRQKRDLFNTLYAVPPMYWIHDEKYFEENKDYFVESYKKSSEITKAAFGSEMISHEFLNSDRSLQRTTFANGTSVTVDFNAQL